MGLSWLSLNGANRSCDLKQTVINGRNQLILQPGRVEASEHFRRTLPWAFCARCSG
jgi:hypothetical protein